ncbi:acyl-CoA dehydrogenase family protein [Kitasatospora sp. NPDC052868]|uniref:acyl-CoA dehydrogenase family protein n=1 Tax=Kitasatospora sp. NPDC052868 TaxID=3364060 RepID=UPI0037C53644
MDVVPGANSAEPEVEALAGLVPLLRRHAAETERHRRLVPAVVDALTTAGLFGLAVPERHGGRQAGLPTQVRALAELGRGCASTSWTASIYLTGCWLTGLFPDRVAAEVFAVPAARISVSLSPTGVLADGPGGPRLTGRWGFNTGVPDAHWDILGALRQAPDGTREHVLVLVPTADLSVHDDWYASGLQGTGSNTVECADLAVPAERVLPFPVGTTLPGGDPQAAPAAPRYEVFPLFSTLNVGTPLGIARAAAEFLVERAPGRQITFSPYPDQSLAPLTHRQLGEVGLKLRLAGLLADDLAERTERLGAAHTAHALAERAAARSSAAYVARLCHEAVEIVCSASGASSIRSEVPVQRMRRDIQALCLHAALNPDTALELQGRIALGLDPQSNFL